MSIKLSQRINYFLGHNRKIGIVTTCPRSGRLSAIVGSLKQQRASCMHGDNEVMSQWTGAYNAAFHDKNSLYLA